jgi:hypothetical protein
MFSIITVIFFFFFLLTDNRDNDSLFTRIFTCVVGAPLLGFIISTLLFGLISLIVNSDVRKTKEVVISSNELIRLDTSDEMNGKYSTVFFVGSGYINETKYYAFYKKLNNGEMVFEKLRADEKDHRLSYSDTPKVVVYGKKYEDSIVENNNWIPESKKNEVEYDRTVIFIPEGTIKRNYKIN